MRTTSRSSFASGNAYRPKPKTEVRLGSNSDIPDRHSASPGYRVARLPERHAMVKVSGNLAKREGSIETERA